MNFKEELGETATMTPDLAEAYGLRYDAEVARQATVTADELEQEFKNKFDNDWSPGWGPHAVTFVTSFKFVVESIVAKYKRLLNGHLN